METAYDSRLVRVDRLLCCSMKRQIKSYMKVHWKQFRIGVPLRKIRKTSFSLAKRLHNVCKKAVNVKNSILILATLLRKTFPLSFQRNLNFVDAVFRKSRTSTTQEKKNLQKVTIDHVIMQWCKKEGYQSSLAIGLFVHPIARSRVLADVLYYWDLRYHTRLY